MRPLASLLPAPVRDLLRRCEADTALLYSLMNVALSALSSPLLLFLIAGRLTAVEQGYYYTFASLAGLMIFVELGVAQTIGISVAHLSEKLSLQGTVLSGPEESIRELSAILKFYTGWYVAAAGISFILLTTVGFSVLSHHDGQANVHWLIPWLLMTAGVSFGLPLYPCSYILYGLGYIALSNLWRLLAGLLRLVLLIGVLLAGYGLYAQGAATIGATLLSLVFVLSFMGLWKALFGRKGVPVLAVGRSALGFQWRVAVAWLSGYAAQFFLTPVLFHSLGPQVAGQFGATYSLTNAASTVSLAWVATRTPRLSSFVSGKEHLAYRQLSRRLLFLTSGCGAFCVGLLFVLYQLAVQFHVPFLHRFLGFTDLVLLGLSCWCYVEFGVMASLLRCFKSEPLIFEVAIGAVLVLVLPLLLIPHWGVRGAIVGQLTASAIIFSAGLVHFRLYVNKWTVRCQKEEFCAGGPGPTGDLPVSTG